MGLQRQMTATSAANDMQLRGGLGQNPEVGVWLWNTESALYPCEDAEGGMGVRPPSLCVLRP